MADDNQAERLKPKYKRGQIVEHVFGEKVLIISPLFMNKPTVFNPQTQRHQMLDKEIENVEGEGRFDKRYMVRKKDLNVTKLLEMEIVKIVKDIAPEDEDTHYSKPDEAESKIIKP